MLSLQKENNIEFVQGAELRHRDMKRDADKILEEFEKRRIRLENAHVSILQRIEQSTQLCEGVSCEPSSSSCPPCADSMLDYFCS
jgi:hypothetical protein